MTIGVPTLTVCSNCGNNFISGGVCVDICPTGTYQHSYADGAKACLQCAKEVGLKLNDLADGCNCLPGYEVLTQHQCISVASVKTNCTGQNVVQNGSVCICSPGTFNVSGVCETCPIGTAFDGTQCLTVQLTCNVVNTVLSADGLSCVCGSGFSNYSGTCRVTCPSNADYNNANSQCECKANFMNVSGLCQACQLDQSYDATLKTCRCNGINQ